MSDQGYCEHNKAERCICYYKHPLDSTNLPLLPGSFYVGNPLHRTDGAAYIRYNENYKVIRKEYWYNGKIHRLDGPAVTTDAFERFKACELYFIEGKPYTEEKYYSHPKVLLALKDKNILPSVLDI